MLLSTNLSFNFFIRITGSYLFSFMYCYLLYVLSYLWCAFVTPNSTWLRHTYSLNDHTVQDYTWSCRRLHISSLLSHPATATYTVPSSLSPSLSTILRRFAGCHGDLVVLDDSLARSLGDLVTVVHLALSTGHTTNSGLDWDQEKCNIIINIVIFYFQNRITMHNCSNVKVNRQPEHHEIIRAGCV